jgi:hypothetical protein
MKTILPAAISLAALAALLAFQHTSLDVLGISAYQSGFQHGVSDGKDSCTHQDTPNGCHWYILEPG